MNDGCLFRAGIETAVFEIRIFQSPCFVLLTLAVAIPKKIPSGKLSHNYGKSPFSMGKLTINSHFQ